MLYIRTTKTSSKKTAVQVVRYFNRKKIIESHIGSAKNSEELENLKQVARNWIDKANNKQLSLFPEISNANSFNQSCILVSSKCSSVGFRYRLLYDTLWSLCVKFKFHLLPNSKILNDFTISRMVEPLSKVDSIEFMSDYFGIKHSRANLYRYLSDFVGYKDLVEAKVIQVAKKSFGFDFSMVFYDLTTLYFESFKTDDIRKIGFSKDNKASNPQIMIGLLVNDCGFPVSYQVFPGNKFEGNTVEPSILSLKKKYKIKNITVVADSAMISDKNISLLKNKGLDYIVGARMASLKLEIIQEISKELNHEDNKTFRIRIANKDDLVCHFCKKRYNKDKRELEKQIKTAKEILKTPSKAEIIKRAKFLTNISNSKDKKNKKFALNQKLIIKAKLLLGIKGYFTSHKTQNNDLEIVQKYKQLWNVERSFKISKSDLKARPIFHNKEQAIKTHILICFMALSISKYIEIKTKQSIKSVIKSLKKITDSVILDEINNKEIVIKGKIDEKTKKILEKI